MKRSMVVGLLSLTLCSSVYAAESLESLTSQQTIYELQKRNLELQLQVIQSEYPRIESRLGEVTKKIMELQKPKDPIKKDPIKK